MIETRRDMQLHDRICIVTGGGRGIGEAVARACAREGAQVTVASRTMSELENVAQSITEDGGRATAVRADVADPTEVHDLVTVTLERHGRVDLLINAAGVYGPIGYAWEADPDEWATAISINLLGTFLCCQAVLPHMVTRREGRIVNFAGGGAATPLARFSAYAASKAAVVRLTETLAQEVREFNVFVNAIAPGAVDTKLQDDVLAAGERAGDLWERIQKLRQTGEGGVGPEVAADLAVYLGSDSCGLLTGKLISAPHDRWRTWEVSDFDRLSSSAWLTLRRIDEFTLTGLPPFSA